MRHLSQLLIGPDPWKNGIWLAVLNSFLGMVCVLSFLSILGLSLLLSSVLRTLTGNAFLSIPFPVPLLFFLYILLFLISWFYFARSLPAGSRKSAFQTALIGSLPLILLSLIGYSSVIWTLSFGDAANSMLGASIFVYTLISTIILASGVANWVVIPTCAKHMA